MQPTTIYLPYLINSMYYVGIYYLVNELHIIFDKKNDHLLDDIIGTVIKSSFYLLHIIFQKLQSVGKKEYILHCCLNHNGAKHFTELHLNSYTILVLPKIKYDFKNNLASLCLIGFLHIQLLIFFVFSQGPVWHSVLQRASQPRIPPL